LLNVLLEQLRVKANIIIISVIARKQKNKNSSARNLGLNSWFDSASFLV
jgi:hypothetical protein